eukprot:GSChrysophyteH1.ASY1.ANO1.1677.1 assembled CDS
MFITRRTFQSPLISRMSTASVSSHTDVLVVGAGLSGLSSAVELKASGKNVIVIDKGRGMGGRLAGRRIGEATFDHGAQFISAHHQRIKQLLGDWIDADVAAPWVDGDGQGEGEGDTGAAGGKTGGLCRGLPTMTGVAKHMALHLDVRRSHKLNSLAIASDGHSWRASLETGEVITAGAVVMSAPMPQTIDILAAGNVTIAADKKSRMDAISYEPCIAVMVILSKPSNIPAPGLGKKPEAKELAYVVDNVSKGISKAPCVTIHASAAYSAENIDEDRQIIGGKIVDAAAQAGYFSKSDVVDYQVHGWRYSKPDVIDNEAFMLLSENTDMPPIVLAGDVFDGGATRHEGMHLENAVLSGQAAAQALLRS